MAKVNTIGILSNPLSGRVKKDISRIREISASITGGIYREASNQLQFEAVLEEFGRKNINVLVIIAGDGTVHGILSLIFNQHVFQSLPVMAIVPAGTTNMTAKDFKMSGKPTKVLLKLKHILTGLPPYSCFAHPVLCIKNGDELPQYGMFFGAAIIAEGVEYFQKRVRGLGITGERASGIVLLRYLFSLMFCRHEDTRKDSGISAEDGMETYDDENYMAIFATCLNRLLLGMRPYWGREQHPIHVTLVKKGPIKLWRSILPLMMGRGAGLSKTDGYISQNLSELNLKIKGAYVIDGEIYIADQNKSIIQITMNKSISIIDVSSQPECQ